MVVHKYARRELYVAHTSSVCLDESITDISRVMIEGQTRHVITLEHLTVQISHAFFRVHLDLGQLLVTFVS